MKYIQGDVIFRAKPVDNIFSFNALPDNLVVKGENHSHILSNGLLYTNENIKFIVSTGNATISHPTHAPITLPAGTFQVSIVKEYDHLAEEAREVKD